MKEFVISNKIRYEWMEKRLAGKTTAANPGEYVKEKYEAYAEIIRNAGLPVVPFNGFVNGHR